MPKGSTRVSKALTNLSIHYQNEEYIADKVLGMTPVLKESDQYWVFDSDRRLEETRRANKSLANMVEWAASTSTYALTEHTLKDILSNRDYDNADAALVLERSTTENLIDKILMRKDYEAHKVLFTTTTFSNNSTLTSATSWKYHTTTSAPLQNVLSATGYIRQQSGKRPNYAVMGWDVFAALKENPNVYGRIQYVQRAIITEELLASLFDLQKVYVGNAVYNSAQEGLDDSFSDIWGADCLIGFFKKNPGIRDATAALQFVKKSHGAPYKVKKWYEEDVEGNYIEVQSMYQIKAVATACGYLYKTAAL
jgi:hypothetical protein